jgi:hypothetical protein
MWQWFEGAVRQVLGRYAYQYLLTPPSSSPQHCLCAAWAR